MSLCQVANATDRISLDMQNKWWHLGHAGVEFIWSKWHFFVHSESPAPVSHAGIKLPAEQKSVAIRHVKLEIKVSLLSVGTHTEALALVQLLASPCWAPVATWVWSVSYLTSVSGMIWPLAFSFLRSEVAVFLVSGWAALPAILTAL